MLLSFDMNLDETQRKKVAAWINEGLKLSDIQKRLETECGLRVTYLDLRLMVDDLKLKPKDPVPPPKPPPSAAAESKLSLAPADAPAGKVSVSVDQLTRRGRIGQRQSQIQRWKIGGMGFGSSGPFGPRPRREGIQTVPRRFAGVSNRPASGTAKAGALGYEIVTTFDSSTFL